MSLLDSLYVGIFGMSVVFIVLVGLSFLINVQSIVCKTVIKRKSNISINETIHLEKQQDVIATQLQLINVDEKTAAIIMAIVCDEIGMSPQELNFKYIKALDDK